MARELWTVDDWPLNQSTNGVPIRDVELNEGLYGPPIQVGSNGAITNRTGELWRPKKHGAGSFVLTMWLAPNPQGLTSAQVRSALDDARDELYRAFQHPSRLMKFRRTLTSGEVRVCDGETLTLAATPIGKGNGGYRFAVEIRVPSGYWTSATTITQSTTASTATSRSLTLTSFAGATAPLEDLTVTVRGGITNPRIQDTTDADLGVDGDWFDYYGTIPADASLVVNCANWTVAGIGGDSIGGFNPSIGAIRQKGGRFLTVEAPRPGRSSTVSMTGVNVSSTASLSLTGHKYFQA